MNIGLALKKHREEKNISQGELSRRTGITQTNLSRWESNLHLPNIADCITLARFYGISLDELVGYRVEDEPPAV